MALVTLEQSWAFQVGRVHVQSLPGRLGPARADRHHLRDFLLESSSRIRPTQVRLVSLNASWVSTLLL